MISKVCNAEKLRINNKLYTLIHSQLRLSLNELLNKDDLFYQLTLIKKDQKDFTTSEIRTSVEKHKLLSTIYQSAVSIIEQLGISDQNILYYAELAEQYTIYGLKNLKQENLMRLYLLCYVHQRFLKINDHLIASLIHKVNGYAEDAELYQKEEIYQAQLLDQNNRTLAANILSLHTNKKIADNEIRERAFDIVPKKEYQKFIQKIKTPHFTPDYYRWEYYSKHSHAIKQNIRLVFKALNFQTKFSNLNNAILFLKAHFQNNRSLSDYEFNDIPIDFIPSSLKPYIIVKTRSADSNKKIKTINIDRYEFMLYFYIKKNIANGGVTIRDSISYKDLEDELIDNEDWKNNKPLILKSLENHLISTDLEKILNDFESLLDGRYHEINQRITSGDNKKIKTKHNKKHEITGWHLPYQKIGSDVNNPFFDGLNISSIGQIIKFTNHETNFIREFTHILPAYSKKQAEEAIISACLVAKGTGTDIYKMKDISDIKEQDLISTYNNFMRSQTIIAASDVIMNKVAKLPIFTKYTIGDYGVHASVDGQKLETKYNTIKARYSSKYYGLGKGISAFTYNANWLPICTKIIGANEHESGYLLDIVQSNTSDIEISAISGDMHSINRVNFILLHMFRNKFMPRFTKLDTKSNKHLVSFNDPKSKTYDGFLIKPNKQVNKNLILKEKDNILRIFATLALKKNSQANIVKKLSSYKSNDTFRALIELDKIVMSLYMLDYIDDEEMQSNVHRSLNRGESYHQLKSAILKVSGKKLSGKTEIEISINNECARLISICIIFYNASLLSKIYEYCKHNNMTEECKRLIRLSPVAWQHINLIGKYEFLSNIELLDIKNITEQLIEKLNAKNLDCILINPIY
jgi:TnpA family transposase